jgi:hypothetical protein
MTRMALMTTPIQNPMQFIDPNNPLLNGGVARLDVGSITPPGQDQVGVVTVRTSSATVTVLMTAKNLREWADILTGLADQMDGGAGLQVATMQDVAALDPTAVFSRKKR